MGPLLLRPGMFYPLRVFRPLFGYQISMTTVNLTDALTKLTTSMAAMEASFQYLSQTVTNMQLPVQALRDFQHYAFGREDEDGFQLELSVSDDRQRVVISERERPHSSRRGGQVGMHRDEVIDLMRLLGREFVLDALADL